MEVKKARNQCPFCGANVSNQLDPMTIGHFGMMECNKCGRKIMIEQDCQDGTIWAWRPNKTNIRDHQRLTDPKNKKEE